MLLLKYCTHYVSKFGKLVSGHKTGNVSFHSNPNERAMPKNAQTTKRFPSFHMLVRLCSKSFKLGFRSMWTKNFQMNKLDLGKPEDLESKMSTFVGKQGNSRKTYISASLTTLKPFTVWITTNYGKLLKRWEYQTILPISWETCNFHALEKEMATHSSVLAWRIPGTAEPGGLPSMGSHGVGHDWSDLAAAAACITLV